MSRGDQTVASVVSRADQDEAGDRGRRFELVDGDVVGAEGDGLSGEFHGEGEGEHGLVEKLLVDETGCGLRDVGDFLHFIEY